MTAQEIKQAINDHLAKSNKQYYSDFYIGITNDIERCLFGEHNVPRKGHWRIHRMANSESHARVVEKHFLDEGMKGGTGGGNADCVYPTFEFKNNSEWKRIRFKDEDKITGIMMPGEPVIFVGGDYIFKLFLNSYDMDSVSNTLRIVQPYHIRTYPPPPPNTPIDTKYLIHEFRIPD